MRYIRVTGSPPKKWWEEALRITDLLKNASSDEEIKLIIEDNEKHWRDPDFLTWLIDQSPRKCWYSEAKESVSSYHVDHFRPKGRAKGLDGSSRNGYWWLAFDWGNYRISGQLLNVKKRDWFPLLCGHPAEPFDDYSLEIEASVLLDPCVESEASLISFNEVGEATESENIDDVDDIYRVEKTIDILGLNKIPNLVTNRSRKWNKCFQKILEYKNAPKHPALRKIYRASALNSLKEMIHYEEEFSSVALACVRKTAPEHLQNAIFSCEYVSIQVN